MLLFKRLFIFIALFFCTAKGFAQLEIIRSSDAQALAQKLVGSGVSISNVTLSGSNLSTAFFRNLGGTQLGIDSGIVLSTGRVQTAGGFPGIDGPQASTASSSINTLGDIQLSQLVNNQRTNDAVILEFDFVPLGDTVRFNYVFSSEEYPEYNCSNYNDVFAFFISGPGITGANNIALVPGTDIPVAINSINNGIPGTSGIGSCNAMGAGSPFVQFYVNNSGNAHFSHNGHTVVLTAKSKVEPCQVYHLKIAIADAFDRIFDSGVFLEAESLKSDPISIDGTTPRVGGKPYLVEGCHSGKGFNVLRPRKLPEPQTVNLLITGTATNGVDVQTIPSTAVIPAGDSIVFVSIEPIIDNVSEGIEILKIYLSNSCAAANFYFDSLEVQLRDFDTLALSPAGRVSICGDNTVQLSATAGLVSYQWSPGAGLNSTTIANPVADPPGLTTYTCTAFRGGSCWAKDSVTVAKKTLGLISKQDINCRNGLTGEIRVSGGWVWQAPVQYSINNGSYGIDSNFQNLAAGSYVVKIKDATGCVDSISLSLVQLYPDLVFTDQVTSASCNGSNGKIELTASGGSFPYTYSAGGVSYGPANILTVNSGTTTVFVKDANGCMASKPVTVTADPPITLSVLPSPEVCDGSAQGYVYLQAAGGSTDYEYSIDGINFQDADSFLVTNNSLTAQVRDEKGCSASLPFTVSLGQPVFVNAGNDTTICEGTSLNFDATGNASSYTWTPHPSLSAFNIAAPVASPVQPTTYFVKVTQGICVAEDSVRVDVWKAPVANAGPDSSICYGRTIQLTGSGGTTYSWLPSGAVDDPSSPLPSIRPGRNTDYYLRVKDANGCASLRYDTVRIGVVPALQVFAGRDTAVAIGQPFQLSAIDRSNSGATVFEWSPAIGLSDPGIANPAATLDRDISYTITMKTAEGCEGSDQISIRVFKSPEIFVPSGFTPDEDGRNDVLRAIPVGMKTFLYFKVYNRWGQQVFSTANEGRGWDGRINGVKQLTGTYVWVAEAIDYNGNRVTRRGSVTLIR